MSKEIQGVLPVVHTPFLEGGEIDHQSLHREVDWAFEAGADGVVAAMASEVLRLTSEERVKLADSLVEMTGGRGAVITSVGAESTRQAREFAKLAQTSGCDAVMAIPPISTSLTETQTLGYFCEIADAVDLP